MYGFIPTGKRKTEIPGNTFSPVKREYAADETRRIFTTLGVPMNVLEDYVMVGYEIGNDGDKPLFQKGLPSEEKELFVLKKKT